METVVSPVALAYLGWIIAAGAALLVAVVGIVLAFHWFRFALNPLAATLASALYAAGCLILLSILFSSIHLLVV